jgi:hypothetical protein
MEQQKWKADGAHVKECLINEIECSAEWRREKAAEYPDDRRNEACASALERLAVEMRALSDAHPLLARLYHLWQIDERTEPDTIIPRYGFDTDEERGAENFLMQLIADAEDRAL